jgi:hydrogenase expression/formation protein HypC
MCLAVPGKIVSVNGLTVRADFRGVGIDVRIDLLPDAKVGEWILAHAGFAIQRMMADEALSALEAIDEAFALAEMTPGESSVRLGNAEPDPRGRSGGDE